MRNFRFTNDVKEALPAFIAIVAASVLSIFGLTRSAIAVEPEITPPIGDSEINEILAEVKNDKNKAILEEVFVAEQEAHVDMQLEIAEKEGNVFRYMEIEGARQGLTPFEIQKFHSIIRCESGGNLNATNKTSGAAGPYQFLPSTWRALGVQGSPYNTKDSTLAAIHYYLLGNRSFGPWVCAQY